MWEGKQVGPFLVEKEIGAGAMGTVYRALYTKTKKRVAVKVVSFDLQKNPKALARFERETVILKKLDHPNIVKIYASGRAGNRPFYAMEFIEGETLESVLHRRTRHTWEEVIRIGQQICAGLHHAHQQGIIHRDLKPANIMVARDGTVKLTDFGIAKGLDLDQLTATNCAIGTASYMSPEQCRGEKNLSHKSDLYSLGVLLYELLVGKRPFLAENTLDMYLMHVEGKFERPCRIVLDIPIWLDTLVCQLLEKDPGKRPFDAATVGQALSNIQDKVEARRSAGVDVVTGKASDKPRTDFPLDENDQEAARTLKAAISKRRRKRKPLISSACVQALAYTVALAALGGAVWWFTRPPAADHLYAAAKKLMDSDDYDKQQEALAGPIEKYFKYYPEATDTRAQEIQAWADKASLALKEKQLRNRMRRGLTPAGDAEGKAFNAVRYEENGDLNAARGEWAALETYATSKEPDLRPWGLLAVQRNRTLQEAEKKQSDLFAAVELARWNTQTFKGATELDNQAALAQHYENFGDLNTALKKWTRFKEQLEADVGKEGKESKDKRLWLLLAAQHVKDLREKKQHTLTPQEVTDRKLKTAESDLKKPEVKEAEIRIARMTVFDLLELYREDPEMKPQLKRAGQILEQLASKQPGSGTP